MSKDLEPSQLPFGLNPEELAPSTFQVSEKKIENLNKITKSTFRKQQEELIKKRKLEEYESTKAIEEFARDFEKEDKQKSGVTFIRGGKINPDSQSILVEGSGELYKVNPSIPLKKNNSNAIFSSIEPKEEKKAKQIDLFMEELKREQEMRDKLKQKANTEHADVSSSNIWVGNLSETVTKEILTKEFEKFGPILNIKIVDNHKNDSELTGRRKKSNRYCFIHFLNSENATEAKNDMDGKEICGRDIDVSWAKTTQSQSIHSRSIHVQMIQDETKKDLIDRTSVLTAKYGQDIELMFVERLQKSHLFNFLIPGNPDNMYYRWRVYSLLQGDSLHYWREEPFQMFINGPYWFPPKMSVVEERSSMLPISVKEKGKSLSERNKTQLREMLETLTTSRELIRKAMGFSIDFSESAPEIVEIISEYLSQNDTHFQSKIARLYLVHDILYNSALVSNQFIHLFRTGFESTLQNVFKSFQHTLESISGRIRKQTFKDQVLKVLKVWEDASIYTNHFVENLRRLFLYGGDIDESKKLNDAMDIDTNAEPEDHDPEIDGEPIEIEDIDFD